MESQGEEKGRGTPFWKMTDNDRTEEEPELSKRPERNETKKTREMNYMQIKCNGKEGKSHQTEGSWHGNWHFPAFQGFRLGSGPVSGSFGEGCEVVCFHLTTKR